MQRPGVTSLPDTLLCDIFAYLPLDTVTRRSLESFEEVASTHRVQQILLEKSHADVPTERCAV